MSHLSLCLLGPPEVRLDGELVSGFPSAKVRALLFYLAAEAGQRRPGTVAHPREVLAGLLWPDYPERSAHTNLSNALSHLRAVLRDRPLLRDRDRADTQVKRHRLRKRTGSQIAKGIGSGVG